MQDEIHKELFVISENFFKIQPWQLLDDCDIFGLFLRDKDELYFSSIMGSGEMEYGVLFLKGWEGFQNFPYNGKEEQHSDNSKGRGYVKEN